MNDRFVEVSHKSWGGRLIEAVKGVLFGFVLLLASVPLLWWNEGRAVRTAKSLDEGQANVVDVKPDTIDPSKDGKLVHVTGMATTTETLQDNAFGVTAQALLLKRNAEMYQWVEQKKTEKRKKVGGGEETVTTYEYVKQWKDSAVNAAEFKQPAGHSNPSMLYKDLDVSARNATLGAFHLPEDVIRRVEKLDPLPLQAEASDKLPPNLKGKARVSEGRLFLGADPAHPEVGDVRIGYKVLAPQTLSVVARQSTNTFAPYKAEAGDELLLVEQGAKDAKQMFQTAQEANVTLTWILRLVGYLMMAFGIALILRPIVVVADFIPLIGNLAGLSATLFAFVVAFPFAVLVIALSWIAVRPLIGVALLVATLLGFAAMIALGVVAWKKRHRLRGAA